MQEKRMRAARMDGMDMNGRYGSEWTTPNGHREHVAIHMRRPLAAVHLPRPFLSISIHQKKTT